MVWKHIFVLFAFIGAFGGNSNNLPVKTEKATTTILRGKEWEYEVRWEVKNREIIEKLIQCESGGVNVSRPDSNGVNSDGILQFNRGPENTLKGGTWENFSQRSGIFGSPMNPQDAIKMTDWAINNGLLYHWSCAKILKML